MLWTYTDMYIYIYIYVCIFENGVSQQEALKSLMTYSVEAYLNIKLSIYIPKLYTICMYIYIYVHIYKY
jgi:hypothetical protein